MQQLHSKNLTLIHGIRGIAALIVAIGHSKLFFWSGGTNYIIKYPVSDWHISDYIVFIFDMASSNSSAMVVIFFVLSGFFISSTLNKNKWTLTGFYKVRFLRIYIPFVFSLLIAGLFFYITFIINNTPTPEGELSILVSETKNSFNIGTFFKTLFFLRNEKGLYFAMNYPYWSLFHEAIFYLIAPFIFMQLKWSFLLSFVLYVTGFFINSNSMWLEFIFHYYFYFNLGMIFFIIVSKGAFFSSKNYYWLIIVSLFILSLYVHHLIGYRLSFLIAGVSSILAIHQILFSKIEEKKIFFPIRKLGMISYSLYLYHVPIYVLICFLIYNSGIILNIYNRSYYLFAMIAVMLSFLLYEICEGPSLKFIQRFRTQIKRR